MVPASTASHLTLAEAFVSRRLGRSLLADAVLVALFANVVALCAQVQISLPFTPVPITGQTFGVLLTGIALGRKRGFAALLLYLAEGAIGFPVFAGGALGLAKLAGPTGGYLLAFPFAAALTGWLAERGWDRRPAGAFAAMLAGSVVVFAFGMAGLSRWVGGFAPALVKGVLPFLPGDLVKALLASILLPTTWRVVRRVQGRAEDV